MRVRCTPECIRPLCVNVRQTRAENNILVQMALSPSQLNEVGDDILQAHVDTVLNSLRDSTAPSIPRTSQFITADVLLRLHNIIAEVRRQGHACAGWTKQAVLARVVGAFTGVKVNRADAEYIGNAQDYYLKNYTKMLTKARKAEAKARSRSEKLGREPPPGCGDRVSELKLQLYKCKFGGVPRNVNVGGGHEPVAQQPVPWRTVRHADEVNIELQQHIIQLKEQVADHGRAMRHNFHILEQRNMKQAAARTADAKADARASKQRAEAAYAELEQAKSATESAENQAKRWKQKATESGKKVVRSEREMQAAENMVLCLQGQLVRALSEAEVESRKRKQSVRLYYEYKAGRGVAYRNQGRKG